MVDCLRNGQIEPWSSSQSDQANLIGALHNLNKHCVSDLSCIKYPSVYAWVLDEKSATHALKPMNTGKARSSGSSSSDDLARTACEENVLVLPNSAQCQTEISFKMALTWQLVFSSHRFL